MCRQEEGTQSFRNFELSVPASRKDKNKFTNRPLTEDKPIVTLFHNSKTTTLAIFLQSPFLKSNNMYNKMSILLIDMQLLRCNLVPFPPTNAKKNQE